jgi:hypothetical protein
MLSAAQAHAGRARDAPLDPSRSHGLLAGDGRFWTAQYRLHRAGESDHPRCASELWHLAGGRGLSRPHTCSRLCNGGERPPMLCVPTKHCAWRSCSHASQGANEQHSASGNGAQPGRRAEPIADGHHARGSLAPCQRVPLERQKARCGCRVMVCRDGEATRRRARREPHAGKRRSVWTASSPTTPRRGFGEGRLIYPPYLIGVPKGGIL